MLFERLFLNLVFVFLVFLDVFVVFRTHYLDVFVVCAFLLSFAHGLAGPEAATPESAHEENGYTTGFSNTQSTRVN